MFDRYSKYHGFMGAMLGLAGASAPQALAVSLAWELLEPSIKRTWPQVFPKQSLDTPQNKFGDSASWMGGWLAVKALSAPDDA